QGERERRGQRVPRASGLPLRHRAARHRRRQALARAARRGVPRGRVQRPRAARRAHAHRRVPLEVLPGSLAMNDRPMARRAFLRGVGGLLVALPALESLGCSKQTTQERAGSTSQALDVNKRLIMFFTSFGTSPGSYFPTGGTETSFTLTPQ